MKELQDLRKQGQELLENSSTNSSKKDDLVSLAIPALVPPADERTGRQEKGLMNVRAALLADPQSAKAVKPPERSFDNPMPAAEQFALLDAVSRDACSNASPVWLGAMRSCA